MGVTSVEQGERVWQILQKEPHRAFQIQDLAAVINPASARKPEILQELTGEITPKLKDLVDTGKVREVSDGFFKVCIFTDETRYIEHAFLGGMGNSDFRFSSPLFRLNIGVISLFFLRVRKAGNWRLLLKDTTAGVSYCFTTGLQDGTFRLGSQLPKEEKDVLILTGRYIDRHQLDLSLRGDEIRVQDRKTSKGTRVDLLTPEGFKKYLELAKEFLGRTKEPLDQWDPVRRGRYVMDQLLQHHWRIEVAFFSATVDSVLGEGPGGDTP